MTKPPSKKKHDTTHASAHTHAAARNPVNHIQPTLKLSELNNFAEIKGTAAAYQKAGAQMRATLQLPHVEELLRQTRKIAAIGNAQLGGLKKAQEIARLAAAAIPSPLVVPKSTLPPPPIKRSDDTRPVVVVTSARDLGQLIRKERESRKLSQQEFADLVGVGRRFISELENGKTTLEFDKVLQVASATGIDVSARRR